MLEKYFSAPKTLRRLRAGPSGPYIDGFAEALTQDGYSSASAVRYLRAAAHLGHYLQRTGRTLADLDPHTVEAFRRHLRRCRCPLSNGGRANHHVFFGAKRFHAHLIRAGICQQATPPEIPQAEPALVAAFRDWFRTHRGAAEPTLRYYCRGAAELLTALGDDLSRWTVSRIRAFWLARATQCGRATAEHLVTAMRAFLRYLAFRGLCRFDLADAVPAVAHWRLASLPACLTGEEVGRLLVACAGATSRDLRDRAILLLLVRLGLRAGDMAQLRLADLEWASGTLRVRGKGRSEVRLPLPQDVGEALLRYLECRPAVGGTDRVFGHNIAPRTPGVSPHCVSGVLKRALRRAGILSAAKDAHLLRHTAATEMLRHGVPLDQIGLVLRHRRLDLTAQYAKVDLALLAQVTQPWPEVPA